MYNIFMFAILRREKHEKQLHKNWQNYERKRGIFTESTSSITRK
jgi:preprotein translocase subunit YajC